MTTALPRDVWVPVPLRWRHVIEGDIVLGGDGRTWLIAVRASDGSVGAMHTAEQRFSDSPDPDDVIPVLIPVIERDAVELTREVLGARLIAGRTNAPPENQ